MDNKKVYSLPIKNIKFESNENSQFLNVRFYAIKKGDNLNESCFEMEGIKKCLEEEDYANKPILGHWDESKYSINGIGDFGGHDSDVRCDKMSGEVYNTYIGANNERPLGFISPKTAVIESYKGEDWLAFEGAIWVEYNKEAVSLLKRKRTNNVSVEIRVIDSYLDDRGYEIITKFTLLGVTIIGVDAGIPNACLNVLDYSITPKYSNFVRAFSKALNNNGSDDKMNAEFLKQDKFGTGEKIELDLTKKSASNDSWSGIEKTKMRNSLLSKKNYKVIIPQSYLVVEEGWEDAPSERLKYPFVQEKGNKLVININGVKVASSMLMKETDKPYFKQAKIKLNHIRKILGMDKLFGIETNNDWGEIVSKQQPKIIKMEGSDKMTKKEVCAKLKKLFEDKEKLKEEKVKLSALYEDKVGEHSFAEDDDKKEMLAKEVENTKNEVAKKEVETMACESDIVGYTQELVKMEDDEEKEHEDIDDEEEERPIDTVGEQEYAKFLNEKSCEYISNSKSYMVYAKDDEVYVCKYAKSEDGKLKMDLSNEIKCAKVFAIAEIKTGGILKSDEGSKFPKVQVEVTKGFAKSIAKVKSKDKELAEDKKANEEIKSNMAKLDELVSNEAVPKEFKAEIVDKIFAKKFKSCNEFETTLKAKLYEFNRPNYLSGKYCIKNENKNITPNDESEQVEELIKIYKNKK